MDSSVRGLKKLTTASTTGLAASSGVTADRRSSSAVATRGVLVTPPGKHWVDRPYTAETGVVPVDGGKDHPS